MVEIVAGPKVAALPDIASWPNLNSDLQLLAKQSGNLPKPGNLVTAIEGQLKTFGRLPYLLIGRVVDDVSSEVELSNDLLQVIELRPDSPAPISFEGVKIVVRDTSDEDSLWAEVKQHLGLGVDEDEPLRTKFARGLDQLEGRAYARLVLPESKKIAPDSVLSSIARVLAEQKTAYDEALASCKGDPTIDPKAYNDVLRIAYNFASDATGLLRLLISVCDLKPVVFWGTVGQHYHLAEAFRALPWLRSTKKPSVATYASTIGDARNSAFHHVFPFRKTLEVPLESTDLRGITIRLFSEYGKAKDNRLKYADQELVDVLTEFTRAREREVAPRFWRQNADVMAATIDLFRATDQCLRVLHTAS